MAVFNNPGYYHALDSTYSSGEYGPPVPQTLPDGSTFKTELGLNEMGTSANPFQNQVQALGAKIREGASKVELEFPGAGKGSSQSPTPESYGIRERQDIRELAKATGVMTSTHATFQRQGFSGLGERGFSDEARYQNIKEIKKAIEFAAEATTGGAIVFHTGEWQRPISETWGEGSDNSMPDAKFQAYEEEKLRATHYLVDNRTGEFVSAIRKDKELFRPKYMTAKDYGLVGKYNARKAKENHGNGILTAEDYVDINKDWIDETQVSRLFERVPEWNSEQTKFEVEKLQWEDIERITHDWNRKHPDKKKRPEEMFIQVEVENQILQSKGHSLFYANRYEEELWQEKKLRESLDFYRRLDATLPENEKWKIMTQRGLNYSRAGQYAVPDNMSIPDLIQKELKQTQDTMRHTHEASAAADAQAREREELLARIETVDKYGLRKSTEGIAEAGMYAYEQTERHKKDLKKPLYVAPENWQTQMYGGHPDELIALVKGARNEMAKRLIQQRGKDPDEAYKLAKDHIKSTIDIGHLNLWRQHFVAKEGESEQARNARFNQWAIAKTKDMIKQGIVGHLHIADNFGWDDEHVTPGEGNAPIKEFVREMEKAGFTDFIVEPGSFNPQRALPDTLRNLGNPIYASGTPFARPMGQFRESNFGYSGPSLYIAGAYSPSNEWKLWSEIPLE